MRCAGRASGSARVLPSRAPFYFAWGCFRDFRSRPCGAPPKRRCTASEPLPFKLDQLHTLQARMPVLADDDMVVHGDAQWRGDVDDRFRHLDIRLRWRRIAGRVVVHQSTAPANALISCGFSFDRRREGTAMRGGKQCLFVIITLMHGGAREVRLRHVRSRD